MNNDDLWTPPPLIPLKSNHRSHRGRGVVFKSAIEAACSSSNLDLPLEFSQCGDPGSGKFPECSPDVHVTERKLRRRPTPTRRSVGMASSDVPTEKVIYLPELREEYYRLMFEWLCALD